MYATGTTTASPALDIVNAVETLLNQTGYQLFDTWNPTGPEVYRVWRNPASNNQAGVDWYLVLGRASDAATSVQFNVGEAYNATTHVLSKIGLWANPATSRTVDADTAHSLTLTINTAVGTGAGVVRPVLNTPASTAYVVSVNKQRVIVALNVAAATATTQGTAQPLVYMGCFDSLVPTSVSRDTGLIAAWLLRTTANAFLGGGTTREPGAVVGATVTSAAPYANSWSAANAAMVTFTPNLTSEAYTARPLSGRLLLYGRALTASTTYLRGLLQDLLPVTITGVTPTFGDMLELTFDGVVVPWVCLYTDATTTTPAYFYVDPTV